MEPLNKTHPLSSKKFLKKMIPSAIMVTFVIILLTSLSSLVFVLESNYTKTFSTILLVALILWLIIIIAYSEYYKAYIKNYFYNSDDYFITIKKGVFAPAEIHVQYPKIQDVYVDQDILDRVLGIYDVHIASATSASAIEAHIDGVDKEVADKLRELFLSKLREGNQIRQGLNKETQIQSTETNKEIIFEETRDISTKTYPILQKWNSMIFFQSIFSALFYATLAGISLNSPGENNEASFAQTFGFGLGAFLSLVVLLFVSFFAYKIIWKKSYSFAFLRDYIVLKDGVIAKQERHLPYRAVQDVSVKQGVFERLFGLATVVIENAAAPITVGRNQVSSNITIPGQSLESANELADILRKNLLTVTNLQTGL